MQAHRVPAINRGASHIPDVPSGSLAPLVGAGRLQATTEYAACAAADAAVICVPTPFTKWKAPDLSYIEAACKALAPYVGAGSLVVLQSTTYPGTTEELVRPLLEAPGRQAGRDFLLAFSPLGELEPPVERPEVEHAAPLLSGQVWLQAG